MFDETLASRVARLQEARKDQLDAAVSAATTFGATAYSTRANQLGSAEAAILAVLELAGF